MANHFVAEPENRQKAERVLLLGCKAETISALINANLFHLDRSLKQMILLFEFLLFKKSIGAVIICYLTRFA